MTDYEAMKDRVDEFLAGVNVVFSVVNCGVRTVQPEKESAQFGGAYQPARKAYEQDIWRVTFTRTIIGGDSKKIAEFSTDYHSGIGNRILPFISPSRMTIFKRGKENKLRSAPLSQDRYDRAAQMEASKVVPPRAADVLYVLVLDAQAADQSFHDWASDFGYETDSIKALNIYNACCEIGREMKKIFNREERVSLEDLVRDL